MKLSLRPSRGEREPFDPDLLPEFAVRLGFYLFCAATAFVILSLTAYTYNLDDIKIPGLFIGGSLCLLYWSWLLVTGKIAPPPRIIWIPYVAYLGVCVVSTMAAEEFAQWVGWYYVQYNTALLGFVLLGSGVIATKKMAELTLKFWVLLTLTTTALGLIHYSGILEGVYKLAYGDKPLIAGQRLQALLKTFIQARSMLSTILNVQFFGNFLLMTLPVVASCMVIVFRNLQRRLRLGESPLRPMVWSVIAGLSLVFTLTCIFTTFAKSSLLLLPGVLLLFALGVYFFCGIRRIPYLGLVVLLGVIMGATVLAYTWADLARELKNVEESMAPRRIIWGGAWQMFLHNPALGVGPGGFRIYFPEFRSPDYHMTRISNVTFYAHNWLLDLLGETGALGTLTYLVFLGGGCWLGWKALRTCPDPVLRVAIVGTLLGIASLFGGSSTTPMSRWPVGSVALHAMIGSAYGIIILALRDPAKVGAHLNPFAGINPWPPARQAMAGVFAASLIFAVVVGDKAVTLFKSAFYHNEGLGYSESIPPHLLGDGAVVTNPSVVKYFREAERLFEKALELNPTSLTTYYKLAHVHNRLGETEKALEDYRNLQKYAPDYAEVHFNLAVIYYNLANESKSKDQKKAVEFMRLSQKSFDRASELSNKLSVWFYRANCYEATAELLPKNDSERTALLKQAGDAFLQTGKLPVSQVIQEANQVERETELRAQAIRLASQCYEDAGAWLEAAKAAERYYEENPTAVADLQRAVDGYLKADHADDALRLVGDQIARNPLNADLQLMRYQTLVTAGRTAEAEEQGKFLLVLQARLGERSIPLLTPDKEAILRATLAKNAAPRTETITP